ncbi:MAG: NAD(P)-dependent oxidoreductase [Novosphingobium sp.]|nr:NAD(P)-dependent oxidoreductase [Novosphingobium sp.]
MYNVFVTGGTGFLGKHFVNFLDHKRGASYDYCSSTELYQFGVIKNFENNILKNIPLKDYDLVIHCAAFTGGLDVITYNKDQLITENIRITLDLLENCRKSGIKKFVFISSSAVYPSSIHPLREEEAFEGDPDSIFFGPGWMKRYCEKLCEFYYKEFGMEILIIRPSNVFGTLCDFNNHPHVIPSLIKQFLDKKTQHVKVAGKPDVIRDFIYVDDFVSIVWELINKSKGFDVFNVATGTSTTIEEVVKLIAELTDTEKTFDFPLELQSKTTRLVQKIDIRKLLSIHTPSFTSLRWGLRETILHYKELYETCRKS